MASPARGPWFFPSMGLRKVPVLALHDVSHKELVLLKNAQLMTLLADYIPVLAVIPFCIGFLHYMARHTELGVFLGVPVIFNADYNAEYGDSNY